MKNRMKNRTKYISRRVWYSLSPDLRKAILHALPYRQSEIVSTTKFIHNIENELRARGEHELAELLLQEVAEM